MIELTSEERQERIREMHADITEMLNSQVASDYERGTVNSLPVTETALFLPDQWSQECIFQGPVFDVWAHNGPKGSGVPYHTTPKHTIVIILTEGEIKLRIEDEYQVLGPESTAQVLEGQSFAIEALEDAKLFFIYYPPIGRLAVVDGEKPSGVEHIMYTSTLKETADIKKITEQARELNNSDEITGVLFYNPDTRQVMQFLEGPVGKVADRFRRIHKDDRHKNVKTLLHIGAQERFFPQELMVLEFFTDTPQHPLEHTMRMLEHLAKTKEADD